MKSTHDTDNFVRSLKSLDNQPEEDSKPLNATRSNSSVERAQHVPCSSFLSLPAELQNDIYAYVLVIDEPIPIQNRFSYGHQLSGPAGAAILRVNRQINREATPILYSNNTFLFRNELFFDNFVASIGQQWEHMTSIAMFLDAPCGRHNLRRLIENGRLQRVQIMWPASFPNHPKIVNSNISRMAGNVSLLACMAVKYRGRSDRPPLRFELCRHPQALNSKGSVYNEEDFHKLESKIEAVVRALVEEKMGEDCDGYVIGRAEE